MSRRPEAIAALINANRDAQWAMVRLGRPGWRLSTAEMHRFHCGEHVSPRDIHRKQAAAG